MNDEKVSPKIGPDSGSLIYDGIEVVETDITLTEYNKEIYKEEKFEKCRDFKKGDTIKWIKIIGFSEIEIQEIAKCFNLHPLVIEDIKTDQRPKIDEYKDYLFLTLKMFEKFNSTNITKQTSLVLGENFVISFQDRDSPIFDGVKKQINIEESIIRNNGDDFLLYSILDTIVDSYFTILEELEDKIDSLEKELIDRPDKETLNKINMLKKDIITIRKGIRPLTEVTSTLITSNFPRIDETTSLYLKNVHDHTLQISEMLDNFRDTASSLLDTYLSSMSNNLNDIVRVLTIISVLFIPLTFITGFLGMNFTDLIPFNTLSFLYVSLSIMIALPVGMLILFIRKKWL